MQVQRIQGTSYSLNKVNNANKNKNNVNFGGSFKYKPDLSQKPINGMLAGGIMGVVAAGMIVLGAIMDRHDDAIQMEREAEEARLFEEQTSVPKTYIYTEDSPVIKENLPDGSIKTTYSNDNTAYIATTKLNKDGLLDSMVINAISKADVGAKAPLITVDDDIKINFKYDKDKRISQRIIERVNNINHETTKLVEKFDYSNADKEILGITVDKFRVYSDTPGDESLYNSDEYQLTYNSNFLTNVTKKPLLKEGKKLNASPETIDITGLFYMGGFAEDSSTKIMHSGQFNASMINWKSPYLFDEKQMGNFEPIPEELVNAYVDQYNKIRDIEPPIPEYEAEKRYPLQK